MDPRNKRLADRLIEMADDELLLGHRDSEWTGHAPILEEDIAFANIAQDELGHAIVWLDIARSLTDLDPDRLVYFRSPAEFRNIQMVELPKGDWAFSMVRQYLFDAWETVHLEQLTACGVEAIAQAARKIRAEEGYHRRHTEAWVLRLGLGTAESRRRMQAAVDQLWPFAQQLFVSPVQPAVEGLPDPADLRGRWEAQVGEVLARSSLHIPDFGRSELTREQHTEYLAPLLEEMQSVARMDEGATW